MVVFALLTSLLVTSATNANPALAFDDGGYIAVPVSVAGAAVVAQGVGLCASTGPACAVGAVVGVGVASFAATTVTLNYLFGRAPVVVTQTGAGLGTATWKNTPSLTAGGPIGLVTYTPPATGASTSCCRNFAIDDIVMRADGTLRTLNVSGGYVPATLRDFGVAAAPLATDLPMFLSWRDSLSGTPMATWDRRTATTVTQTCRGPSGSATRVYTPATYAESTTAVALEPCPSILPNSHRDRIVVTGTQAGGAVVPLLDVPTFAPGLVGTYPDCTDGAGSAPCTVRLFRGTGTSAVQCGPLTVDCADWQSRNLARTQTFVCRWVKPGGAGFYSLPIGDCGYLATSFQASATQTDPQPSSAPSPVPGTVGTGTTTSPTTNPDGSTTLTERQTLPDGSTRTVTTITRPDGSKTVTTQPTTSTGTAVGSPTVVELPATGSGTEVGTETSGCMGSWTWNPVAWVYRPVRCALSWAFVPSQASLQASQATATAGWQATGITAWGTAVSDVGGGLIGVGSAAGGCAGPQFSFTLKGTSYNFDPLDACSQPMQGVAVVVKVLISLAVIVAGVRVCARPIMASFGMNGAV